MTKDRNIITNENKRTSRIGEVYGILVIIGWKYITRGYNAICKCRCGNLSIVKYSDLKNKTTSSCGCIANQMSSIRQKSKNNKNELVGKRFGKGIIQSLYYKKIKNDKNILYANLICDCNSLYETSVSSLKRGHTRSCGCFKREQTSLNNIKRMRNNTFNNPNFEYDGDFYRSSYEVRYVKILKAQGLEFQYEPKCFLLSNGKRYLPDFYIPKYNLWIEVKGYMSPASQEKINLFKKDYNLMVIHKEDLEMFENELNFLKVM